MFVCCASGVGSEYYLVLLQTVRGPQHASGMGTGTVS